MFSFRQFALACAPCPVLLLGLTGCAPEHPDVIPSTAQMNLSSTGMAHYVAPDDGMVYIYDQPAQRLVWSGRVYKGQAIDVDPTKSTVAVGGTMVVNKMATPADRKDIYFDASPLPSPQPAGWNTNSVTVTPNVTVQPTQPNSGGVNVQPGVNVAPAPAQPSNP